MGQHCQFGSDYAKCLLAGAGLCDLNAAFRLGEPLEGPHEIRASRHDFKRVVRLDLHGVSQPTRVYIKRQWRRERWIPRMTDIRYGLKCTPIREWDGLQVMKQAGFHVAEPLAVFWDGLGWSRGAVVTMAVPPEYSLADLLLRGELQRMSGSRLDSLIESAVAVVAQLSRQRLSWRSMKAKHFYPEETASGDWRIWLIDCESVRRDAAVRQCAREWKAYLRYVSTQDSTLSEQFASSYSRIAA